MIFGYVTAEIAAEFADILPGDFTAKAAFLVRELLARLPENSVRVKCSTSSEPGLLEVSGQWHDLERTHDILRSWMSVDIVGQNVRSDIITGKVTVGVAKSTSSSTEDMVKREHKPATLPTEVLAEEPLKSPRKRGRPRKQVTTATEEPTVTVAASVAAEIRRSKRTIKPRSFSPTPLKKTNCSTPTPKCNSKVKGDNLKATGTVKTTDGDTERSNARKCNTREKLGGRRNTINRVRGGDVPCSVSDVVKLQCGECSYHTASARNLDHHRKRMHMSRDFGCDQCDKTFGLNKDLIEHKHWHKKQFSCEYCHKKMAKAYLLDRHMSQQHQEIMKSDTHTKDHTQDDGSSKKTLCASARVMQQLPDTAEVVSCDVDPEDKADSPQTEDTAVWKSSIDVNDKDSMEKEGDWFEENPVKCTLCKHQTTSQLNMRYHVQRMHMERKHKCSICCKKFGLKKDLSEHQRWHSKTHTCTFCSKKFATVYLLNGHLAKRHGHKVKGEDKAKPPNKPRLPLYGCKHCSYITKFSRNFRNHLYRHHVEKTLQCQVCSKMFALPKDLKQHMVFHTEQVFPCGVCGKKLRSKFALKIHTDGIHKGIKNTPKAYLCTLCGKLCRNITAYKEHQNREHLHVKPFKCDTCGMAFHGKATLKMHKLKHTSERNFPCKVCGKAFKGQPSLNAHLLIHKQVRPFECETCKKGFTQKAALVRHRRIHTGERPYQCKLCKSTFNDNSILRRHVIGIHKIRNGKLGDDIEWEVDQEQTDLAVTPTEMVIEIKSKSGQCALNTGPKMLLVTTEAADNSPPWLEHSKTEATAQLSGLAAMDAPQQSVGGQTTDVLMPSPLQFCSDNPSRTASSSFPCQSDTTTVPGIVDIGAASNSNVKVEDTTTANWELCSVTNPSHMGVTMSGVEGSASSVGIWERGGVSDPAAGVVTTEKPGYTWDSQVVPSASNETIVYAPLSLEPDGVYILVSDSVMSTTGETPVTLQDTGQQ